MQSNRYRSPLIMLVACLIVSALAVTPFPKVASAQSNLDIQFMETGRNDDSNTVREELVFRVQAMDTNVGDRDGDGIRNVVLTVKDSRGNTVSTRRENNAGYCAFGGGEPDCNVYNFADHNFRWPNGDRITDGNYTLQVKVTADDGRSRTDSRRIRIETGQDNGDNRSGLSVQMMETGRTDADGNVRGELVFRVQALDPNLGDRDGDGIRNVVLTVKDPNGRAVSTRRENNAGYCAFGGGEPDCNVYNFADHNNRWPNGDKIREGTYTLIADVTADDGRTQRLVQNVEVRR